MQLDARAILESWGQMSSQRQYPQIEGTVGRWWLMWGRAVVAPFRLAMDGALDVRNPNGLIRGHWRAMTLAICLCDARVGTGGCRCWNGAQKAEWLARTRGAGDFRLLPDERNRDRCGQFLP